MFYLLPCPEMFVQERVPLIMYSYKNVFFIECFCLAQKNSYKCSVTTINSSKKNVFSGTY